MPHVFFATPCERKLFISVCFDIFKGGKKLSAGFCELGTPSLFSLLMPQGCLGIHVKK